jgi:hypothetical protein
MVIPLTLTERPLPSVVVLCFSGFIFIATIFFDAIESNHTLFPEHSKNQLRNTGLELHQFIQAHVWDSFSPDSGRSECPTERVLDKRQLGFIPLQK